MDTKNINIDIPEEIHTRLKIKASEEGITLKAKITEILKKSSQGL